MIFQILQVISISFISNVIVYLIYIFFIKKRLLNIYDKIKRYEDRISSIVSPKRRSRTLKLVSKELQAYYGKFRFYLFLQTIILSSIYLFNLFLIISYYSFSIYLPIIIPYIQNSPIEIPGSSGPLLIYVLSFFLFTPLSMRRPKFE